MGTQLNQEGFIKPKSKSSRRKWLYGSAAVVVVLGIGIPVTLHSLGAKPPIPASDIYQVGYGSVTQTASSSGTLQVPQQIDLNFTGSSGVLASLSAKVGQHVKKGQVLATLNDATAKIAVEQAQTGVTQAEANVQSDEAKLTQTKEGATSAQLTQDEITLSKTKATLQSAQQSYQDQISLYNDRTSQEQAVQNAQNTLTTDEAKVNDTTTLNSDQQKLQAAQATLAADKSTLAQDQTQYGNITQAQVESAYQAYQNELADQQGWEQGAYVGTDPYSAAVQQDSTYYSGLNSDYNALQTAKQTYTQQQATVAELENQVTSDQSAIAQAKQQVVQDQQALKLAEQTYNNRASAQQALDQAKSQVSQDKLAVQSAAATVNADKQPPDPATLQEAQATLTAGQAALQSAEAQLQSAQLQEQETQLTAPITGVITQVNIQPGETVSSSTAAIVLDDTVSSDLQDNIQVSESQIGSIKPGEPMTFTATAYPGQSFTGDVVQVYPTPTVTNNVTQYTVLASVQNPAGTLKAGMTTNVTIQTASKSHVLIIPAVALQTLGNLEGVYVYGSTKGAQTVGVGAKFGNTASGLGKPGQTSKSGTHFSGGSGSVRTSGSSTGTKSFAFGGKNLPSNVHFQPIKVGLMGTSTVEVTQGLTAGEKILISIPGQAATTSSSSGATLHPGRFGGGGRQG